MRRHGRTLAIIALLVTLAGLALGFQTIKIGGFERGGDTPLGLKLGLDLQGGIHLVYQAQVEDPITGESVAPTADQMDALKRSIERRVNKSGLGEPIILLLGEDRLLVQLPGVSDVERAKSLVGETARLEFKHRTFNVPTDIEGVTADSILSVSIEDRPDEPTAEGEATPEDPLETDTAGATATTTEDSTAADETTDANEAETEGQEAEPEAVPVPAFVLEFTPDAAESFAATKLALDQSLSPVPGGTEIFPSFLVVSVEGIESRTFQITSVPVVEIPGGPIVPIGDVETIERIEETDSFRITIPSTVATNTVAAIAIFGEDPEVALTAIDGKVDEDIGLTGDDLARAYPGQHSGSGVPIINIEFKDRGTQIFGDLTTKIAGTDDQIAIFLDEEELIAPVVQTAITSGVAFIQGRDFTVERTRDISLLLESGRLPIPIGEPILERDVGPSLGRSSLDKSMVAGAIGLGLVLLFMALYYRGPGLVAAVALLIYATLLLAVFKILPVTLTLSGVAAAILSVGMAVDANILIFERMKEELRQGRTLLSAINIGFNRAWPAIRDGNVSTLITCAILFWFSDQLGATIVQGFAITLAVGVGLSMFSAIFVSRTLLRMVADTRCGRRLEIFVPAGSEDLPQRRTEPAAQRS